MTEINLPALGCGCAALGNLYTVVEEAVAQDTLAAAWEGGLRYFDTAPYYGHGLSETRLARFLADKDRADYQISTKVGRSLVPVTPGNEPDCGFVDPMPFAPVFDYSSEGIYKQVASSQKRLGVEQFDALYIHDIGAMTQGERHETVLREALEGALPALSELKEQGVVKAIGIGVNEIEVCLELLKHASLDVILLAGRYTLLEQGALEKLLPECESRSVAIVIGGPFNSGLLAGGGHYNYGDVPAPVTHRLNQFVSVCKAHGVALPAAALQFPLAHPSVTSVIPGTRSPLEIRENIKHFSEQIPAAFWRELKDLGLIDPTAPTPD